VAAQGEVSIGLLMVPEPSVGGAQFGPMVSVAASGADFGWPLFFEAGLARTDFTSLDQDYHHNHYFLALGAEWFPTQGTTRVGLRVGLGAYGEYETVETDPSSSGGDNWVEAIVPGLILERDLGRRRLVMALSDFVIGPYFAILDPEEYGIEHRIRFSIGMRF